MRDREEIRDVANRANRSGSPVIQRDLMIELLLDIRDGLGAIEDRLSEIRDRV